MVSTGAWFRQPLKDAFRRVAEAGFDAVEVMVTQDPATQDAHRLRALSEEFGVSIESIHGPFLLITRSVWGAEPLGKIYRSVQLAEEVGAQLVVVHPPYRWQVRYRRWVEHSLAEFSARTGVTVAVENMFPLRVAGEKGLTFHAGQELEELEEVPYLVLDTSHAAVSGVDIRDFFSRFRDQLQHVHLSNNAGRGWDSHLPVYEAGVLPLTDFLGDLVREGFAGSIALELDLRPWMRDPDALREVLVRSREFCEAALRPRGSRRRTPSR
jgi:sugar phosphate isomerase/epimerase